MYYEEHEPPHFHAEHHGQFAAFDLSGTLLKGHIQSRAARRMIRRWAREHKPELRANWASLKRGRPLAQIPPLP